MADELEQTPPEARLQPWFLCTELCTWRLDQLRRACSRELPKLPSVQHSNVRDAVEAECRAGVEAVVRSRRKLQDALAKASLADPEFSSESGT